MLSPVDVVYRLVTPVVIEQVPGCLRYNTVRGVSLIVNGDQVTSSEYPSDDSVRSADYAFIGGHEYLISVDVAEIIYNAGFGSCLSFVSGGPMGDIYFDVYGDIY